MSTPLDPGPPTPASALAAAPYKGLDYFEDSPVDRLVFAGRDGDIREVLARIVTQRVLVVYGRSGLGKTSLLLAGIFPRLREQGFQPVYVRALGSLEGNLTAAIRRTCQLPPANAQENVFDLLARVGAGVTLVLVFDQFEEFFIQYREQHRELATVAHGREELARKRSELAALRSDFVDLISGLISDESKDVHVVFSLREDHLAALDDFQRNLPDLFRDAYRLLPLTAFGAREAIVQPLLQGHLPYDERLVTRLVNELAEFEFDSARLQITCLELFRLARAESQAAPRLKEEYLNELIEARGTGLDRVFRRYLAGAVQAIPPDHHLLARTVLDSLITSENTKRALGRDELMQLEPGNRPEAARELQAVLDELCAQKLVRPPAGESGGRYELIHECLVPEILKWLETDPDFASFRQARDVITNNCRGEVWRERPELLLSAEQLSRLISPHKEWLRPDGAQLEFVLRSSIYHGGADAGYWADRFDRAQGIEILLTALSSALNEHRRAAAAAAKQFKDPGGRLFDRCWQLALEDGDPGIRQAAGKSLGSLGTKEQLQRIKAKLSWFPFRTSKPAWALLADLSEEDRKRAGVLWRWRWPARRMAERRVWKEFRETIEDRRTTGTWTGLWAGLAWGLVCLPLFALMFGWIEYPLYPTSQKSMSILSDMDSADLMVARILYLGFGLALAAWLGRRTALAGARVAVIYGEGRWFNAVQRMGIPFWGVLLAVVSTGAYLSDAGSVDKMPLLASVLWLLAMFLLPWAGRRMLAKAVQVGCDCMWGSRSTARRLGWCVLTNLLLTVMLPGWLILPFLPMIQDHMDPDGDSPTAVRVVFVSTVVTVSALLWIMSLALVQSVELADDRPARPPGSRKLKKTALAGAGLMLVWLCWQYGWDAFPQFAPRLTDAQGYVGKLSAWPKTAHFQVQSTNRLFRVKLPEGVDVQAADARGRFKGKFEAATHSNLGSDVLFLPSGAGELAVDSPRAFSPLQLLTPLVVGHNTTPTLLTTQYQVVECDLTWSESAHAWTGEIGGHLSSGAPKEDEYVNLYSDLAEASLFSGTNAFSAGQFANDVLHFQAGGSNSFDLRLPTNGFARWLTLPAGNGADEEAQKFAVGQDGTWKIAVSLIQTNAPARPTAANRPARNEISSNSNYQDAAEPPRPGVPQATFKQDLDKGLDKVRGMAERGFTHPLTGQDVRSISLFVGVARWQLSANEAFEKGREFLDLGETNAALTWFSQAVQLSPGEADNQNSLAWQLFLAGRLEEALGHAKEAVRIKPQDASYWDTLAHAEQGLHQWGEAVHAWDQLVKLNPGYFATHTTGVCARDEELYAEARRNAALAPAPRPAPLPGK